MNVQDKNVIVLGVADEGSIAWAIARAFHAHGSRVWIGYQQKFFSRVRMLLRQCPDIQGERCDVTDDEEMRLFFDRFRDAPIDVLVHSIAYAPSALFTRAPSAAERDAFDISQEVSVLSLAKAVRYAKPHLREWGSVIALTSDASQRAMPIYGGMGVAKAALESMVRYLALELGDRKVRVNTISAAPIETPAALGIVMAYLSDPEPPWVSRKDTVFDVVESARTRMRESVDEVECATDTWRFVCKAFAARSAIPETVSAADVADCALFLGSDYSRKITGQVLRVDCGFSSSMII